jgi:hypothetical protein
MTVSTMQRWLIACGLLLPLLVGCAAFRPMKGIPACAVPDEYRGPLRSGKTTIDLALLRQSPPVAHRVDSGDLLSIYIEGVLGRNVEQLPVYFPQNSDVPPSVGYPLPVREDGTISLPYVGALPVRGLTLLEVESAIRQAYTVSKEYLNPGRDRVYVSLQRPRSFRITVIRQEAASDPNFSQGGGLNIGMLKRGTGEVVILPVYRNDVLNALAETGGLPGLDAENAIYVIRNGPKPGFSDSRALHPGMASSDRGTRPSESPGFVVRAQSPNPNSNYRMAPPVALQPPTPQLVPQPDPAFYGPSRMAPAPTMPPQWSPQPPMTPPPSWPQPSVAAPPMMPQQQWSQPTWPAPLPMPPAEVGDSLDGRRIIRIPVRLGPGEVVDITEPDILLHDGDIVFIESRDTEVFYTGGLLGGGQYSLPRDYDLDVLGAIAVAQGQGSGGSRATTSVGGQSALNNDVSISASQVIILRPLGDGTQIPIKVDLYRALRDPGERVIIQPGDYLLLQYTRLEAVCAFIERHLLEGALFGLAAAQLQTGSGGN